MLSGKESAAEFMECAKRRVAKSFWQSSELGMGSISKDSSHNITRRTILGRTLQRGKPQNGRSAGSINHHSESSDFRLTRPSPPYFSVKNSRIKVAEWLATRSRVLSTGEQNLPRAAIIYSKRKIVRGSTLVTRRAGR